jgi:hypothetical protein
MPDVALLCRLETIVQSAYEPDVRQYLNEVYKCYKAEAYNAAVLMAWCAVIAYFRLLVLQIGVSFLAYHCWSPEFKGKDDKEGFKEFDQWQRGFALKEIPDRALLEALEKMYLVKTSDLTRFRQRRNSFAHPDNEFASEQECIELIEMAKNVYCRRIVQERVGLFADIIGYATVIADKLAVYEIGKWVEDAACLELAHKTLAAYLSNKEASVEGLLGLWQGLWTRLTDTSTLWKRLEQMIAEATATPDPYALVESIDWIIWPEPETENAPRDRIAGMYINWLKTRVDNEEFKGADIDLARRMRQYLPVNMQQQLQNVIEEMKRRF